MRCFLQHCRVQTGRRETVGVRSWYVVSSPGAAGEGSVVGVEERRSVLIVDDHPVILRGLRAILEGEPWVKEVLEATTVAGAVREAVTRRVDVVVMDVRLPDGDGIEATRRIVQALPDAMVLIVTMDCDEDLVARAMDAGAHGFVLKDLDPRDLVASLRAVAGGGTVLGPHVGKSILAGGRRPAAGLPPPLDQLTPRELEILTMIVAAQTTTHIARRLGVTEKTVRNQLSGMFSKLGVRDRVQAALLAQRLGVSG
jgi:two-component system nitrate/nitrite response regulator NarL